MAQGTYFDTMIKQEKKHLNDLKEDYKSYLAIELEKLKRGIFLPEDLENMAAYTTKLCTKVSKCESNIQLLEQLQLDFESITD